MPIPIHSPSGYAATRAVAFADLDGNAVLASAAQPLPVTIAAAPAAVPALTGVAATATLVGPFQPVIGRSVILALSGSWTGSVRVLRSTDGGTSKLPLTLAGGDWGLFSTNCCEAVWDESEAAAQLWLDLVPASGSVQYRLGQ